MTSLQSNQQISFSLMNRLQKKTIIITKEEFGKNFMIYFYDQQQFRAGKV